MGMMISTPLMCIGVAAIVYLSIAARIDLTKKNYHSAQTKLDIIAVISILSIIIGLIIWIL